MKSLFKKCYVNDVFSKTKGGKLTEESWEMLFLTLWSFSSCVSAELDTQPQYQLDPMHTFCLLPKSQVKSYQVWFLQYVQA
jgi:hypothetical protein